MQPENSNCSSAPLVQFGKSNFSPLQSHIYILTPQLNECPGQLEMRGSKLFAFRHASRPFPGQGWIVVPSPRRHPETVLSRHHVVTRRPVDSFFIFLFATLLSSQYPSSIKLVLLEACQEERRNYEWWCFDFIELTSSFIRGTKVDLAMNWNCNSWGRRVPLVSLEH